MSKGMKLKFMRPDKPEVCFVIDDIRGSVYGRILTLTKPMMTKLVMKLLYWNLNVMNGICFGEFVCHVVIDGDDRRMDLIECGGVGYHPTPEKIVDRFTSADRAVEFFNC